MAREFGIRRYGFHGATHRSASERTQALLGRSDLRHISCHLGGSSSLAAFRNGVAIDVSMGASPQSGLPQNNRVGDIDVFAVLHMMKKLSLDPDEMAALLGSRSGLAGISGTSGDIRDLDNAAAAGDRRSQLALDVFVHAIRHYLGAFLLELGGVDAITFSGGIGENSAEIRSAVLKDTSAFGNRNRRRQKSRAQRRRRDLHREFAGQGSGGSRKRRADRGARNGGVVSRPSAARRFTRHDSAT